MLFYNPYFLFRPNPQNFSVYNRDNEDYFLSQGEKYGGQGEKYGAQGEKYGAQGEKYGKYRQHCWGEKYGVGEKKTERKDRKSTTIHQT